MLSLWRKLIARRECGAGGAELAVILPVFSLLFVGIVAAARIYYLHLAVMTAAGDCVSVNSSLSSRSYDYRTDETVKDVLSTGYGITQDSENFAYRGADLDYCRVRLPVEVDPNVPPALRPKPIEYRFHFGHQFYQSDWGE